MPYINLLRGCWVPSLSPCAVLTVFCNHVTGDAE